MPVDDIFAEIHITAKEKEGIGKISYEHNRNCHYEISKSDH
jgi:hypothetical protein